MEKSKALEFDAKKLFNYKELQGYGKDFQKGFLGFLIRNEKWEIKENKIVFPDVTNAEKIKSLFNDYGDYMKMEELRIKRSVLNIIQIFDAKKYKKSVEDELKKLIKKQKSKSKEK